jgi:uncharacterized protein YndB with AHSA1/START domain
MLGEPGRIRWRLHLSAFPSTVYQLLATPQGRRRFWAEDAPERDGVIRFRFANGETLEAPVLERREDERFALRYFDGRVVQFELEVHERGGTDLTFTEEDVPDEVREEQLAGWAAVLLALKVAADFRVDLRNHDASRTWDQGYVDG